MRYRIIEKGPIKYVEALPNGNRIVNEQDALDWIALCGEYGTNGLMLHDYNLTEDFYRLSSGLAGAILLKFTNYYIKVAAVLTPKLVERGKFHAMALETNRGSDFRIFYEREKAEDWLVGSLAPSIAM
jgi:PadR family transcriptional regulator AphA